MWSVSIVSVFDKLIPLNSGGPAWPQSALRPLMTPRNTMFISPCAAVDKIYRRVEKTPKREDGSQKRGRTTRIFWANYQLYSNQARFLMIFRGDRGMPRFLDRRTRGPPLVGPGHAAYYGRVGPRRARKIGRPTITRKGHHRADGAESDPSTLPPESTGGMVVNASTKPWPRQLGSSIVRALPPPSQLGRVKPDKSSQVE